MEWTVPTPAGSWCADTPSWNRGGSASALRAALPRCRAGSRRVLVNDPAVLFADESTGALKYSAATSILDLFGGVHDSGTTMVDTHDARVAARADRVLVLIDRSVEDLRLGLYEETVG